MHELTMEIKHSFDRRGTREWVSLACTCGYARTRVENQNEAGWDAAHHLMECPANLVTKNDYDID